MILPILACLLVGAIAYWLWSGYWYRTGDLGKWVDRYLSHEINKFHKPKAQNDNASHNDSPIQHAIREKAVLLNEGDRTILLLAVTNGRQTMIFVHFRPETSPTPTSGLWDVEEARVKFGVDVVRRALSQQLDSRSYFWRGK